MKPRRKDGILSRELKDGTLVILHPDGSQAIMLNAMGAVIWSLCDGESSLDDMTALICQTLPAVSPLQVRADLITLLEQLLEKKLIEDKGACG